MVFMKTINNCLIVTVIVFFSIITSTVTTMAGENKKQIDDSRYLYKDWVIYKSKAPSIPAMTPAEAATLKNKIITIKPNQIIELGKVYDNCLLTKKKTLVEDYFYFGFRADYKKMGLKNKLTTVYKYSCDDSNTNNGGESFSFLKYDNELIYNDEGYFFYLRPLNP